MDEELVTLVIQQIAEQQHVQKKVRCLTTRINNMTSPFLNFSVRTMRIAGYLCEVYEQNESIHG
eukprot:m.335844 g.335844  ORF g.335844 m.335844 type:complete len:64 (-) comp16077_c1_seq11:5082-5273(-)